MLKYFSSFATATQSGRKRWLQPFWPAALVCFSLAASAQTAGLRVVAVNVQGQPVAAVTVQLKLGGKLIADKPTDDKGAVQFDNLKPGAYEIVVSKDGFVAVKRADQNVWPQGRGEMTLTPAINGECRQRGRNKI